MSARWSTGFAVLVAEEMFASCCELLISVHLVGTDHATGRAVVFILIDRALRDESTRHYYLPPSDWNRAAARCWRSPAVCRRGMVDAMGEYRCKTSC
jgi:hypothetical protein